MAHEMRVKGRLDPIVIDYGADVLIAKHEIYLQTKVDEAVVISGWHGRLSLINDFMATRSSSANVESTADKIHQEYLAERQKVLAMSLEERAARMGFFRLVYWMFTGKRSEDVKVGERPIEDFARDLQMEFFAAHPKRIHCDPGIFRPLIKSQKANRMAEPLVASIVRQEHFAQAHL